MANQQNETLVRRLLELMDQPQLPSDYTQLFDPHFKGHYPIPGGAPEEFKDVYNFWHGPFPDVRMTVEQMLSDGDLVAAHWMVHGTNTGNFFGNKPTGKKIDISVTGIFRCHNGKIAEAWIDPDRLGVMEQLGIVEPRDIRQRRAA